MLKKKKKKASAADAMLLDWNSNLFIYKSQTPGMGVDIYLKKRNSFGYRHHLLLIDSFIDSLGKEQKNPNGLILLTL